ncbi:MAG: hypothetical protein NTW29_07850 [Bacteroidetes bacterium]|nr:hypothetical protein [Bacteroidota bacterium]
MKKAALIFLFIFSLVQALPAMYAWCNNTSIAFIIDEEKSDDKKEADTKVKKELLPYTKTDSSLDNKVHTAFISVETLFPPPCLKKLVPPPDHC